MLTQEKIDACRKTNLYSFIKRYDPHSWKQEGPHYLRSKVHDSCIICSNGSWYWNSRGLSGKNPIDFICSFYGLPFLKAVEAIFNHTTICTTYNDSNAPQSLPARQAGPCLELYSYLCMARRLQYSIIRSLVNSNKIYLSSEYGYSNICFLNPDNNHFELIGISSKRFKRISDASSYWIFGDWTSNTAYICESAIDAISLYQLTGNEHAVYISIGGSTTRKKLIESVIKAYPEPILAVDNDAAGDKLAEFFPQLPRITPTLKDWNEDLIAMHDKKPKGDNLCQKN